VLLVSTIAVQATSAWGAEASTKATAVNDLTNYKGDRVSFAQDMIVEVEGTNGTVLGKVCLPRKWQLRGGGAYTANGTQSTGTESGTHFTLLTPPKSQSVLTRASAPSKANGAVITAKCDEALLQSGDYDPKLQPLISEQSNVVIRVTSTQLSDTPPDRFGLTYGVLTVPFKYHVTGAKAFTGSASVGPYAGYRTDNEGLGYGLSFIGFLGASNIAVPQNSNGSGSTASTNSTQNLFGVSYGLGVVATLKTNFQLGLVVGADRVNANANYEYNGKPWVAAELGYAFLQ
jgi:hypothetical protein